MPPISFARDIRPLFRPIDVTHMKPMGVMLDDYNYMSDPASNYQNAEQVQENLSAQNGDPPAMPPGGPYWSPEQLALFAKWRTDGYQP
jgi:hypothetical protein